AQQKGEKLEYVVPDPNVSIDIPISVIDKNVDKHGTREVAEAFVQYLYTPEAQAEFVKLGFRPLDGAPVKTKENTDKYPAVKTLGTIQEYGGWSQAQKKFFDDGAVFDQVQASIKR
ncbi:substrate-binding domain-containing protein, partial [Leptolyngbya sp. FACHB-402]